MRAQTAFLLAAALSLAVPAAAQGGGKQPPAAQPPKAKPDKPKDDKKPAEPTYATEVMVLHATNSGKGIDSAIGNMPELKKPPFSAYDSYELLNKVRLPLTKEDKTMNLPNGRVVKTKLLEVMKDKEHLRLNASINRPGGKTFLPLLETKAKVGQTFIVAGQKYKGGILVLVFRVTK